jgi:cytochrome c oxidase assembly protein subunit 15
MAQSQFFAAARPEATASPRQVRAWLLSVAALVFLMVSVGGATRLTGSGLSITEWQPIIGIVPPLSETDWQEAFAKYRQIPQYEHLNKGMSLHQFKLIFWWEWAHRFLGRLIGFAFLLPFLYFLALGRISRALLPKLLGIFVLGGLQGAVGWYMVRSGLADRIYVSHYRLALHLALAILILGALLWLALSLGNERDDARSERQFARWPAALILALAFVQTVLGALVAGLKAGLAHNTWPLMDGRLIPDGLGAMRPWYLNLFENTMTVQFNHRMMAYVLVAAALGNAVWAVRHFDHLAAGRSAMVLAAAVLAQAALGVWTLVAHVPLALGFAHQAGAAVLFSLAVWHLHTVRHSRAGSRGMRPVAGRGR